MQNLKKNNRSLLLVFAIIFSAIAFNCQAFNSPGYIITTKSDTIYGWIQLSRFDQITGRLILNGIEEESFHSRVVFIANEGTKFKTYFPEMLFGFGFTYKSTDYVYRRISVQRKSIVRSEQEQYRFMRLVNKNNAGSR